MLGDEALQQVVALRRVEVHDFDATRPEVVLAAHERPVLADDDAGDAIEQDGAGAHVTRRERRRHRRTAVLRGGQPAGNLQRICLAVVNRASVLDSAVVPRARDLAVDEDRGPDRDAALGAPDARLLDGDRKKLVVCHQVRYGSATGRWRPDDLSPTSPRMARRG